MVINVLITEVTVDESYTVVIFDNLTLKCELDGVYPHNLQITYQWHRFGGNVPAKSIGTDSAQLTIPKFVPEDQGKYFCTAVLHGHCAESNHATVTANGKKITLCKGYKFHDL